jgi:F-type H+-transporting ATPase subunit gamma
MATTREIKRRIRSVKNVAQITRALQLVASSKMRKTQDRAMAGRPYSIYLMRVLANLARAQAEEEGERTWANEEDEETDLPQLRLLQKRDVKTLGIVLITPDRGLAGALTSNINRYALNFIEEFQREHGNVKVAFVAVGRRGKDFLVRNRLPMLAEFINLGDIPKNQDIRAITRVVSDAYLNGEVDSWFVLYPRFVSALTQTPTAIQVLPLEAPSAENDSMEGIDYIFEPSPRAIYAQLLPRYLETVITDPIFETVASFYAAQFVAMKNATDNASQLADDLNLTYNKARQAAITTQILEVVAGASAE